MPPGIVPDVAAPAAATLVLTTAPDGRALRLAGPIDRQTIPAVYEPLMLAIGARAHMTLGLDLGQVERVDSAGVAMLGTLARRAAELGTRLWLVNVSEAARDALALFPAEAAPEVVPRAPGLFERLGGASADGVRGLVALATLAADTFVGSVAGARRTRRVRRGAAAAEAIKVGVDALPIVGLIAFLIGVVVALQSAAQLRELGASRFVADLIAISMTREMGPLMTAIIVAGRSGAAIAAEVATMQVSQEVDALATMGLDPVRYIVVPKFQAMTLMLPCLTIFASTLGVLGGFAVSAAYLDLSPQLYWSEAIAAVSLGDFLLGFLKSVTFAWLIVLIAAHRGFQARGGAESVGRVTTTAVVSSIFWVIVADACFSLVFYFEG